MNELSTQILDTMENSRLGQMSVHVLSKQSEDLGLDLDDLTKNDLPPLVDRLKSVLPFFLGDESYDLVVNIRKLGSNGLAVV